MQNFLIAVVSMAFVLGVMIIIHELGHHLVAKFFGVRVETFSVGFGKRLFGFRMGETDYRVSALPFGGYVKMAGENPMEQRTGDPGEFMSHPRWQRILIAVAGPAMNIILAVTLLTGVFMVDFEHPTYSKQQARVDFIEKNSPAAKAGILAGDLITRFGNAQNPTWEDVRLASLMGTKDPISVAVQRNAQLVTLSLQPEPPSPTSPFVLQGLVPPQDIEITDIEATMPLYQAGARLGDVIKSVDGKQFNSIPPMQEYLAQQNGAPLELEVLHEGKLSKFKITPILSDNNGVKRFRVGFRSEPTIHEKLAFVPALQMSIDQNKKFSFLIVEMVQKMVERKVSIKQLEGPVRIAQMSGEAVRAPGWIPLILLMAAISLNLGIMNLLPIPILDGGLILLTLIEGLIRRDIDQRVKERIYQTAFVFLVIFAVAVVYNDVSKMIFTKYLP